MISPLQTFARKKREKTPIVMLALYDAVSAQIAAQSGVDALLVGDSMGNTALGFSSTIPVKIADIARCTGAVARGVARAGRTDLTIVADLPLEALGSDETAISSAIEFLQNGAHAVKLEGAHPHLVEKMARVGVPVMGHLGFTPQSVMRFSGIVQGKTPSSARQLLDSALELEKAGAFAVVLEAVAREAAQKITESCAHMATIGIGAGAACDGQVLVFNDLVGLSPRLFKFAKSYTNTAQMWSEAIQDYIGEVEKREFPSENHSWPMEEK